MKKKSFDRYLPFWTGKDNHWTVFWGCVIATAAACTYLYLYKLLVAHDCLIMILPEEDFSGEMMPDFIELLGSRFWFPDRMILYSDKPVFLPLLLLILAAVGFAIYHYATLRRGAKSNYLMGRLPDRKELRRRCLTLPLLMVLAAVVLVAVLLPIFYGAYLLATPDGRMQPDQLAKLWQGFPNLFFPFSPLYVHVS